MNMNETYPLLNPAARRRTLKECGLEEDSILGRLLDSIENAMSTQVDRMKDASYWISSNMDGVNHKFANAALTRSLQDVRLNSVGEIQGKASAYDSAVVAFSALNEQRTRLVDLAKREHAKNADQAYVAKNEKTTAQRGLDQIATRDARHSGGLR